MLPLAALVSIRENYGSDWPNGSKSRMLRLDMSLARNYTYVPTRPNLTRRDVAVVISNSSNGILEGG